MIEKTSDLNKSYEQWKVKMSIPIPNSFLFNKNKVYYVFIGYENT